MRKYIFIILVLFCSLFLGSCDFAAKLNEKYNLQNPVTYKTVKIYANNGTDDSIELTLDHVRFLKGKRTYSYDSFYYSFSEFSQWVNSLSNGSYRVVGFCNPERRSIFSQGLMGLGSSADCFYSDSLYLLWDDPYDTIKIKANNGSDKFYEYKLPSPVAYNESVTLDYSKLLSDSGFKSWVSELESVSEEEKYAGGFIQNDEDNDYSDGNDHFESKPSQYFTVSKCDPYVNLSWNQYPPFDKLTIHANNGTEEKLTIPLDKIYVCRTVYWSELVSDTSFDNWYKSLNRTGYLPIGLSCEKTDEYKDERYPDCSEGYGSSIEVSCKAYDIYVQWVKPVTKIEIYANNGTKEKYVYDLGGNFLTKDIRWSDLENDAGFKTWLNSLTNGKYFVSGITEYDYYGGLYPYCSSSNNGSVTAIWYQNSFYVQWICDISEITFYANNGSNKKFVYKFNSEFLEKNISWNDLAANTDFIKWYNGLSYSGYIQTGIQYGMDLANGYSEISPENPTGEMKISCKNMEFYVEWKTSFSNIRIYANYPGQSYYDNYDYFVFDLGGYYFSKTINWELLSSNQDFVNWYNSLYKEGYYKEGMYGGSYWNGYISPDNPSAFSNVNSTNNRFYIHWEEQISEIYIYPNNGDYNRFTFKLEKPAGNRYISWNELAKNQSFMNWYKNLSNGSYRKNGISIYPNYGIENNYSQYSNASINISSYSYEFYVYWESPQNTSLGTVSLYCTQYECDLNDIVQTYLYTNNYGAISEVMYKSTEPSVAEIDSAGYIRTYKSGTTKLSCEVTDYSGNKTTTAEVTFTVR